MDIEKLWATDLETHLRQQNKDQVSQLNLEATSILAKISKAFRFEAVISILIAVVLLSGFWIFSEQKTQILWVVFPIFAYILIFYCVMAVAIKRLPDHDPSAPYAEFLTQSISKLKTIQKMYYLLGTLGLPFLMMFGTAALYVTGHINISESLMKLAGATILFTIVNYVFISRTFIFLYDRHIKDLIKRLDEMDCFWE